jgi:hypothetical protein
MSREEGKDEKNEEEEEEDHEFELVKEKLRKHNPKPK